MTFPVHVFGSLFIFEINKRRVLLRRAAFVKLLKLHIVSHCRFGIIAYYPYFEKIGRNSEKY
jgi:uncharacterized membrane protein